MPPHAKSLFMFAFAAMAVTAPAHAQTLSRSRPSRFRVRRSTISANLTIDQASGLGYFADKDNKGVVVFDTKTDKYVSRIPGFVGVAKTGNNSVRANASWSSTAAPRSGSATARQLNHDTSIRNPVLPRRQFSHGRQGACPTAWPSDPDSKTVIVANSNDAPRVPQPDFHRTGVTRTSPAFLLRTSAEEPGALRLSRAERHVLHGDPVSRTDKD